MVSYLHITYLLTYNVDTRDPIGSKKNNVWWNFNFSLNSNQTTHQKIHWRSTYWKSGSRNVWRSWEAIQHQLHPQQLQLTHLQQLLHPPANVLRFMLRMWLQQFCANCGTNCKGWRPATTTTTTVVLVVVSEHLLSWCCAPTGAMPPAPLCCASCGVKYKHSVTR